MLDPHILSVNGVTIKYSLFIVDNNSTPETMTIRSGILEQFSAGVDKSVLFIHSQSVRNLSAAAPVH